MKFSIQNKTACYLRLQLRWSTKIEKVTLRKFLNAIIPSQIQFAEIFSFQHVAFIFKKKIIKDFFNNWFSKNTFTTKLMVSQLSPLEENPAWLLPTFLNVSQYSASGLRFDLKLMHFLFKDMSWGPNRVIWKCWWLRAQALHLNRRVSPSPKKALKVNAADDDDGKNDKRHYILILKSFNFFSFYNSLKMFGNKKIIFFALLL